MTKEEFIARCEADKEFAPGWDAIEGEFARLYPGQEPEHYGSLITSRAIFGGNEYLDGYSLYRSQKGYFHLVSFGMSELYAEPDRFGGQWSRWGYEMTMKLREPDADSCRWALNLMGNLARYTYQTERYFEANQYVAGSGEPLNVGSESKITGLLIVPDTEAQGQDTVYGRLEFLQLVGATDEELQAVRADRSNLALIISRMKQENPDLVTDLSRTKSYL